MKGFESAQLNVYFGLSNIHNWTVLANACQAFGEVCWKLILLNLFEFFVNC